MWDCIKCTCKAIAGDLGFCPQCFEPKEDDVAKVTSGGASNAAADLEAAAAEAEETKRALLASGPEKDAKAPVKTEDPAPAVGFRAPAATGSEPATSPPVKDA